MNTPVPPILDQGDIDSCIIDSITDFAVIASDLQGRVTRWNEGARRILGWTAQEMLGQPASLFFTPEDNAIRRPAKELEMAALLGRSPDERWHIRKSGERFWASGEMMPLKDRAGRRIGYVKVMRDQTSERVAITDIIEQNEHLGGEVAAQKHERDRIWRNSLDLMLVVDREGIIRDANPAWTSALGHAPAELQGKPFASFAHPEDAHRIAGGERAGQPAQDFEVRLRGTDGGYRWFSWRAFAEDGLVYANGRDVTLEKRQAAQLQMANRARLHLALAAGEMGAWEWRLGPGQIVWLQGASLVHGLEEGKKEVVFPVGEYLELVHPDDRARLTEVMSRAAREGAHHRAEYRVVWPDKSVHWIEARGDVFLDEAGRPSYMAGVSINITRRKRSEQDQAFLARASAELAALIDAQSTLDRLAYLAVPSFADWCAIDMLDEDGRLQRVAVAHVEPEKVQLAHELHRRFPPDPQLRQGTWEVLRSGAPQFVPEITDDLLTALIKDPERIAMMRALGLRSYLAMPLSINGKPKGVITFFAAESGRRYDQEDVQLARELAHRASIALENAELYRALKAADQAKNVFLAMLAHELRNPLAAIISGLGLLSMAAGDKSRVEQYTRIMERQAGHLSHLVDDLMDAARITTGKIELKRERTSLAGILTSSVDISRAEIERAGHRISVSLPGEPTPLHADPVRLAQVFSNLLANAAKYTRAGGEIDVSLECGPQEYTVRVRDNGVGIAPDMLRKVFRLFTQVSHPLERSDGGLGIGLALVDGLVALHGGSVEAASEGLGRGSEFIVRLPRHAPPAEPAGADASGQPAGAGGVPRKFLVVDDNVDAATTISEILRMLGHEVAVVHDGLAAVDAAAADAPDIVLMDIGLPGIDGYEAGRRIRALPRGRALRLIAVSGWGQAEDKERSRQAGFDEHWVKPVGLDKLKGLA